MKIKSLTYIFLFKKFVDCDFNHKYYGTIFQKPENTFKKYNRKEI